MKPDWTMKQVGRLALRVQGLWWVAYYALPDTMDDAIELARIRMKAVQEPSGEHRSMFIALMRRVVEVLVKEKTGQVPSWTGEEPAPESERAGQA